MGILTVLLAAVASYIWGAIWYGVMAKPWMAANGLTEETIDRKNPVPYILSFVATVLVAGMMRHMWYMSPPSDLFGGLVRGIGIGLFLVVPWIATNNGFAGRPFKLTLIDGTYATVGCIIMSVVVTLMMA